MVTAKWPRTLTNMNNPHSYDVNFSAYLFMMYEYRRCYKLRGQEPKAQTKRVISEKHPRSLMKVPYTTTLTDIAVGRIHILNNHIIYIMTSPPHFIFKRT